MEMRTCPYCAESIRTEAIKCRYCASRLDRGALSHSWYRQREGKMVAGVCAGLATEWGISLTLVRLAFIIAFILGFWSLPVYLALWIIMPMAPLRLPPASFEAQARDADLVQHERGIPPEGKRPYL